MVYFVGGVGGCELVRSLALRVGELVLEGRDAGSELPDDPKAGGERRSPFESQNCWVGKLWA